MGAPFKQTQQLSKIGNGVIDWMSFSDNEHGPLMMSRGTQEHVDCTESSKLSREVNMDSNSTADEHLVNSDEFSSHLCDGVNKDDDFTSVHGNLDGCIDKPKNNTKQQTYSANAAATNTTETSSHTTTQDQLQSVAARSVLEMSYTKEQVLDALRKINELRPGGNTISGVDIMHVLLKDDDDNSTQTAAVTVATQGTSRGEEQTGNTHDDNYTQGAATKIVLNGNNHFKDETGHNMSDFTKDEYTRATMGAPFKQTQQLSKIGNGVSDWLLLSNNEHGPLTMSRGTQEHVDCTESSMLSREVNMDSNSTPDEHLVNSDEFSSHLCDGVNKDDDFTSVHGNLDGCIDKPKNNTKQQTYSANATATNTTETSSNHTTTQDQLQSVAARSVLEMGYTKEQVLDALRKINELRPGGNTISGVDIMHVLLKDDDGNSTQTATVAVATQGTSRDEEQTGNTYDDNSTQGTTAKIVINGNNHFKEDTGHNMLDFTKDDTESLISSKGCSSPPLCGICNVALHRNRVNSIVLETMDILLETMDIALQTMDSFLQTNG